MAFAMFARVHDINTDNYSTEEMRRCYEGLRNNLPHLLPFTGLSDRDKRKAMRAKGLAKPPNMMVADVPMVGIPAAIGPHIHRYARKLAAALYYREKGKAARLDLLLWTHWAQSVDRLQMEGMLKVAQMAPFRTVGTRINLDFGDRFGYRCDKAEENDLFMAIAQFGQGLVVSMLVAEGLSKQEAEQGGWVKVSAMFD